eukprot:CAMPEP_0118920842 /NCGR_PEP_ID=MMETSP1169-20130426/272_1 /TAXON_ID=36882 /ORGANISM="Pyramimonas obovata, Strain CCMP722" /LENGTH=243 /DNA_ID=CAMNT_0006861447 /DNA_START=91 /DNA_END=822 /DNA_ORIENTATION=-
MDTGKSNLNSRAEIKLDSGKAYLDFDQGNLNAGKLGIKEFKPHSKVSTSLWFQPSTNKGGLEVVGDVGHDTTVTVSPNYPLPSDVMQVPVKLVTKKKVKAVDAKVTAQPLQKAVNVELSKNLSNTKHFQKGSVTIDHPKDTISLQLQTKQYDWQNIKHDLRLTIMTPFGNSTQSAKNTLLYTGEVNKDLKVTAEMCQPQAKGNLAKLSAKYKMGDIEAVASCDLTGERKLENHNLQLKTTLDI